jgi:hypothetical protein
MKKRRMLNRVCKRARKSVQISGLNVLCFDMDAREREREGF